jgi:transposase
MAKYTRFINDEKWELLESLLPKYKPTSKGGRPPADNREVLEGILWVLRTGARWCDLPDRYPSPSTCWRRLSLWEEQGVWLDVWRKFLSLLDEEGLLDWEEAFIDGSFAPAKKGALLSEKPKREKGPSGWWWSTARVFLWEASLPRHRPQKSGLRKKRLKP